MISPRHLTLPFLLAAALAQQTSSPPAKPFQPQTTQAAGAGPDKVWVNTATNVYHCPGARFYGRTKEGRYMTEPQARTSGAHPSRGQTCFTPAK